MNRRQVLSGVPAVAAVAGLAINSGSALSGEVIESPFLHTLTCSQGEGYSEYSEGDVLMITPGAGPWDDTHLLKDGRLAAVQVVTPNERVTVTPYDGTERFFIAKSEINGMVAGRVVKRVRLFEGYWA